MSRDNYLVISGVSRYVTGEPWKLDDTLATVRYWVIVVCSVVFSGALVVYVDLVIRASAQKVDENKGKASGEDSERGWLTRVLKIVISGIVAVVMASFAILIGKDWVGGLAALAITVMMILAFKDTTNKKGK